MTDTEDEELRALDQHIAAQREMLRELQRRNDFLEREWAAKLATLSPRERKIAELAEDDPAPPAPVDGLGRQRQ
jgi:hypothetical protein